MWSVKTTMEGQKMRSILSVLMGLVVCLVAFGQAEADLVGYWSMDEIVAGVVPDLSGNGNNGTLQGDAYLEDAGIGSALSLDGDGDYLDCGVNSALNFRAALTIEAWINVEVSPAANKAVGIVTRSWRTPWGLRTDQWSGDKLCFSSTYEGEGFWGAPYSSTRMAGAWHHVAVTWASSTGKLIFYVNGVEMKVEDTGLGKTFEDDYDAEPLKIGCILSGNFFIGQIDEVVIYSHAVTADKINDHYVDGKIEMALQAAYRDLWGSLDPLIAGQIEDLYNLVNDNADAIGELDGALDALAQPGASGIAKYERAE